MPEELCWCFDPLPPSGARQGGDPAQFVFAPDVAALIRETLQNSNDQLADGCQRVDVSLRPVQVAGERLRALREALRFDSLRAHLNSVDVGRARFSLGLRALEADTLEMLWIEDRGTTGLVGSETGSGNFAALCRDRLFSEKKHAHAGGSFGLGKAVLWRFSQASTVAFYSRLASGPDAGRERLIVKSALPFHTTDDGHSWAGEGWFGRREDAINGTRAVSVWDSAARELAVSLGARPFKPSETGTSICIVAFGDPAAELASDGTALTNRLAAEVRTFFWPALVRGRLAVDVSSEALALLSDSVPACLAEMLERYDLGKEQRELTTPGDVAVERIAVQVPERRDGRYGTTPAFADVIIQLAEDGDEDLGLLWCFRGPGMIVQRRDLRQISLAARPFRAILVCGEAVRDVADSSTALEVFLKTAEPPAHDRWGPTPRLREEYKRGWKVELERLMKSASESVRKHVAIAPDTTEGGPEKLRRLFKAGTVGGGRSESEFHFRELRAQVRDEAWHFKATVIPNLPTEAAWSTVVDIEFPEERGTGRTSGIIARATVQGADFDLVDGRLTIWAPPGTESVDIAGSTDRELHPAPTHEAAVELVIRSHAEVSA